MEVLAFVGGVVVFSYLIWFIGYVKKGHRYINLLNQLAEQFDTYEYKSSEIYKERLKYIEEVGLSKAISDLIFEIRLTVANHYNMSPRDFNGNAIKNAENQYIMRYVIAHGKSDEFQNIMTIGKEISDFMKKN